MNLDVQENRDYMIIKEHFAKKKSYFSNMFLFSMIRSIELYIPIENSENRSKLLQLFHSTKAIEVLQQKEHKI